ncbi:MAG: sugar transferase [Anaerolineae bacterium]
MKHTRVIKRAFDLVFASLALLMLWPLFIVLALVVWCASGRPVFYAGIRAGQWGRPFRMFKYRTMVPQAERLGGPCAARDDPRVTRVGRFLRRYKLDELPQFINVLRGEMSIVGPRPEVLKYTQQYEGDQRLVLSVRPGITDLASIEFASQSDILGNDDPERVYEERVRPIKDALRLRYVVEQSLWLDLCIIIRTGWRLLRR